MILLHNYVVAIRSTEDYVHKASDALGAGGGATLCRGQVRRFPRLLALVFSRPSNSVPPSRGRRPRDLVLEARGLRGLGAELRAQLGGLHGHLLRAPLCWINVMDPIGRMLSPSKALQIHAHSIEPDQESVHPQHLLRELLLVRAHQQLPRGHLRNLRAPRGRGTIGRSSHAGDMRGQVPGLVSRLRGAVQPISHATDRTGARGCSWIRSWVWSPLCTHVRYR